MGKLYELYDRPPTHLLTPLTNSRKKKRGLVVVHDEQKTGWLGIAKVLSLLEDGHVYLCFEGKGKDCHRHILAAWLRRHRDITVTEIS